MHPLKITLCALVAGLAVAGTAHAQQQLIPTPYPSQLGSGSANIDPSPRVSRHQRLIPTPYPRSLGPNALGNPRPTYRTRHQRLVKPPYPRQYR